VTILGTIWWDGDVVVTMGEVKGTGEGGLKIRSTKPSMTERMTRERFPSVLKARGRSGRLSLYSVLASLR
jgi:hypothetical protein